MEFSYPDHTRYHAALNNTTREDLKLPVSPWENCDVVHGDAWNGLSATSIQIFQQETPPSNLAMMKLDHTFSHLQAACDLAALSNYHSLSFDDQNMFLDSSDCSQDLYAQPSIIPINTLHPEHTPHIAMSSAPQKTRHVPKPTSHDIEPNTPQSLPSTTDNSDSEAELVMVGSVYAILESNDYVFKCSKRQCVNKTYSRWYDLKRHYEGAHTVNGAVFWCPVRGCERSQGRGGRPFPRKDKMRDHTKKKHKL